MGQFDRFRSELWSFTYLAVRRALSLLVLALRRSGSKEIEILVLRHELEILRRNQPRPCLQPADRAWLATLSRLLARERWSAFGVRPETLLRWHSMVDRLQHELAALVESRVEQDASVTFQEIDALIRSRNPHRAALPSRGAVSKGAMGYRAHLTEPWFCCSEPTEAQLTPLTPLGYTAGLATRPGNIC